ncbi:Sensory histidine kinase in two-component regulatory system with RstA [Klebsiella pneumoniae subsp. pneumoniae]|nr:Sensory histidine kinase in two-component regulatory system with RstA [Klebsiella pneumoniae subsp. pneumoniae]
MPYLYFLHEMRLLDVALMAFIAISLAFPVFIWMRPHWQDMLRIETAAQRFGEGHLSERIHFDSMSSFERLGVAFNQMADNINALIASKKQLIDGIAHELRTPLVRLRYRLEMSENLSEAESQALNRDIGQLEALIEELLTYARLDRPQTELSLTTPDFPAWISDHVEDIQMVNPQREVALATLTHGNYGALDMRLMERVLDNLVNNALRYSSQRVAVSLTLQVRAHRCWLRMTARESPPRSASGCLSPLSALTPAGTGRQEAAASAWRLSTVSPRRWAARCAARPALSAAPASALAGRSIISCLISPLPE